MDIQQIVLALMAAGMTQKSIADRVGCSQPTISDIAHGHVGKVRPSYQLVVGLEKLLAEVKKKPRLRASPSAPQEGAGAASDPGEVVIA